MNNGDKPASPLDSTAEFDVVKGYTFDMCGLTKRESMAIAAMQGLCVNVGRNGFNLENTAELAVASVQQADALLKALEQSK